ncbi:MAG: hypothetical protein GY833_12305 [Aestuariibacter sp.]|nr:hypothetical protein [Aestuariibacter sp.]
MTTPSRASAVLAKYEGMKAPKKIETITNKNGDEVILVKAGEWDYHRKAPNADNSPIKLVSMVGGRNGADYEIVYRDHSSQLFKFEEGLTVDEALSDRDFAIREVTIETPSKSFMDIPNGEDVADELLKIDGVSDVQHYASFVVTCSPDGVSDRNVIRDLQRIRAEIFHVLKAHDALES